MYTIVKEIHSSTTVEHCIYCHFFNFKEKNLVIASFNQLKVFRLIGEEKKEYDIKDKNQGRSNGTTDSDGDANEEDDNKIGKDESNNIKVKLECLKTIPLYCEVTCLKSIKLIGSKRDSLLISFADAKLALVEYDPTNHDLKTLSLHYFEEEEMKGGRTQYERSPIIRVDPEGRCAAMLVYGRTIIILPFRKDLGAIEDTEPSTVLSSTGISGIPGLSESTSSATVKPGLATTPTPLSAIFGSAETKNKEPTLPGDGVNNGTAAKSPVMASYKLNLNDKQYAEEKIHNIIDFQFLNGYYEPTLLILHEPVRTWAGRVAVRRDTCSMVTLSLNVHQRVHPIIWSTSHLPFDCFAALPVPKPVGGVIILAINSLIYLNQSVPPFAVSLNSFADSTTAFTKTAQKGVKLSLDCAKATFVSNDKLVISLKGGELYVVTLFSDGMRSIRAFHFDKSASSVISSCISTCEEGYLFLGSRLGNSLLLKYTEKTVEGKVKVENGFGSKILDEDDPMLSGSPVPEVLGEVIEPVTIEETTASPAIEVVTAAATITTNTSQPVDNGSIEIEERMDVEATNEHNEDNQANETNEINESNVPFNNNDNSSILNTNNDIRNNSNLSNDSNDATNSQSSSNSNANVIPNSNSTHINSNQDDNPLTMDNNDEENPTNALEEEDIDLTMADLDDPINPKQNNIGDWAAGDVALMKDPDELEVYGPENDAEDQLPTSFSFELCDSLINIGPCGRTCMGEPAFVSDEFTHNSEPQVELVTTSGYGKNGAICVLQRTVRPQLVTTFELPNCLDMWTVYSSDSLEVTNRNRDNEDSDDDIDYDDEKDTNETVNAKSLSKYHSYLILTRTDSTMILKTGREINELDHSDVSSQTPTIFAGNLADGKYILQVSPMAVRLLEGTRQVQHLPLNLGSPIVFCSLVDPYGIILTQNGAIALLTLRTDSTTGMPRLAPSRVSLPISKSKVVTLCVFRDVSGKFTTESSSDISQTSDTSASKPMETSFNLTEESVDSKSLNISAAAQISLVASSVDDEDELLYGSSGIEMITNLPDDNFSRSSGLGVNEPALASAPSSQQTNGDKLIAPQTIPILSESEPTYWLFTVRENGVLEIFRIPDFTLVFYVKNFPMGPRILLDTPPSDETSRADTIMTPVTREILVTGMGLAHSRPIMFTRFDSEILVYEMFPYFETQIPGHLKIRWRRKETTLIVKEPRLVREFKPPSSFHPSSSNRNTSSDLGDISSSSSSNILSRATMHQKWFRPYSDVSGYSGVFICGPFPHWCFMTSRGELRIHEMSIDGPVLSFAPFHNINCPKGFLYINAKNELRIAVLPTHVTYDAPWPVRKVPLRCTINFVNYHVDSKCYCVVTSTQEIYNKLVRVGGEEKDYDVLERDSRYIWPTTERFHIQLFSPVSWEMIPGTKITLDEWEHVTCIKNVMLNSEGTESGLKGYIAAGTNYCYGEDVTNRGRIWILDIIDVVPELGQPLTRSKIKIVYCKEQKGPVTAICQIRGLLLSAVGQKIYIWQLKESQLVGVAFIDTQIYIHQAVSVKNLILIADVYKSISLLRYQEDTRTLALASRDCRSFEVFTCEFVIDGNQLCFLVADGDKNLLVYSYQPESRESHGGTRLIRKGDFHLGSHVNCFFRIRCKYPSSVSSFFTSSSSSTYNQPTIDPAQKKAIECRQATVFSTLDGTIGYILPVNEKNYRRLFMLQNTMNAHIQHTAGVNPKGVHMVKFYQKCLTNPCKNMLDGDLLYRFYNLSMSEKAELCKKIGTTPDQIIDDLQEIDRITAHF